MRDSATRLLLVGVTLTLLVSAVPGGVLAQDSESTGNQVNLDSIVSTYNANVGDAPAIARGRFAGETLELRVGSGDTIAETDTGDAYQFETNGDGEITEYGASVGGDPSIRIRTSESTFDTIVNAEDPAAEFDAQYEAGNVEISGLTITKALEVELAKFAVWLGKTFGLL